MDKEQLYRQRLFRIEKAINFEPVEQIPLIYMGQASAPRQIGVTIAAYLNRPLEVYDDIVAYLNELGVDGCNVQPWYRPDVGLTATWLSRVKIPGRDLPEDIVWQVEEKEIMTVEDYDTIINQGYEAFMGQYLPRVIDMRVFQEGMAQTAEVTPVIFKKFWEQGIVILTGAMTTIPFEPLCGGRSMVPFFLDLYRIPEKVKEVMDIMTPGLIGQALRAVEQSGIRRAWVGGWRSASALLNPKLWDQFVFPYFQQVVSALAENDIVSILHLDQDWTRDIERFRELPVRKCILNPDGMTDIRKAREALGDHMAILGDVPPALLASGTPDDVYNYVRDLIKDVGPKGLLLCPGCDAPINAKGENMVAMYEAGREFGKAT